jgi:tRNA nucleotidyltransferase (CCA-adding enzyme)
VSGVGSAMRAPGGDELLAAVAARPGGPELLAFARARGDVALVGGATRDLLLGREPRELDVVVAGDAAAFAEELVARIGDGSASITSHERFGTVLVDWATGRVDIAERRAETYPLPGALPQVRGGSGEEDLRRRDFTVNAIALALGGRQRGRLDAAEHALEDLADGRLRVLHERSFTDDPTRLLRLARYRTRLGFETEPHTAELAADALAAGALGTVSRARVGAELRLALLEPEPVRTLAALEELGVLAALDPRLRLDEGLARRALALLPEDGRPDALLLAVLLLPLAHEREQTGASAILELLDALEFTAAERGRVARTASNAQSLLERLRRADRPSDVHEAAAPSTLEAVALAAALDGEPISRQVAQAAEEWLRSWRHVHLAITGDDLLAAGLSPGPEIGRRLAFALARRLDGELADGREAELRAALGARV